MKTKQFMNLLFNPFTRIAGWQAFFVGFVFIVLSGIVGTISGVVFDGVLDMHFANDLSFLKSFAALIIDIISLVLVFWVIALIASKNFRFIDILGTMTLARIPFFFLSLSGFLATAPDVSVLLENPQEFTLPLGFIVVIVLSIPLIIWSIVLMYNGFKVSCNLSGSKLAISFIVGILIAEVVSKIFLFFIWRVL